MHQKSIALFMLTIISRAMLLSLVMILVALFAGSILPNTGILAYESSYNIYLADIDRNLQRPLTYSSAGAYYFSPAFAPDGERIAVVVGNDPEWGRGQLFIMDLNGKNLYPISTVTTALGRVSWLPDGKQIVFSPGSGIDGNIYTVDIETHKVNQVNKDEDQLQADWPTWSPDGKQIAFVSWRTGNGDVYLMDTDGTQVQRLTSDDLNTYAPAWSPDGKHITFPSGNEVQQDIYDISIETGEVKQLTNDVASKFEPVWSPDGMQIAFLLGDYYKLRIYLMDADGENVRLLTHNLIGGSETSLSWRP